ncbi:hypothetical protein DSUL_140019 [Desulfovibrionales bacterium]
MDEAVYNMIGMNQSVATEQIQKNVAIISRSQQRHGLILIQ